MKMKLRSKSSKIILSTENGPLIFEEAPIEYELFETSVTMSQMSFETRLAALERMQGPPDAVLEEAAKIVGIDLGRTIHQSFLKPLYTTEVGAQGFKEQWILRWLLKRLGVSDSKSKSAGGDPQPRCGPRIPNVKLYDL